MASKRLPESVALSQLRCSRAEFDGTMAAILALEVSLATASHLAGALVGEGGLSRSTQLMTRAEAWAEMPPKAALDGTE